MVENPPPAPRQFPAARPRHRPAPDSLTMNKLCIFTGMTIFGVVGSLLANAFGMDTISLGSFFLSGVGSIVGVYVGWKIAQKFN
jgi:hypothetical protein